jgi:hypothetical protein
MRINPELDIYVLEGAIDVDSLSFANKQGVGLLSASAVFDNDYCKYIFDNSIIDNAGRMSAIKHLNKGHNVFLWKKFIKDYPKFIKCKDMNDIHKKTDIKNINFDKYFGCKKLDVIFL